MKELNLVFICDDDYIIPTMTAVYSVKTSKKKETVCRVNILANTNQLSLYDCMKGMEEDNFRINLVQVRESIINELANNVSDSFCVATPSALLKFFIPSLLPECEKILYLDGDILVKEDLTELYETNIEDVYGAVVTDSGKLYSGRKIVKEIPNYFNSGMMLLNTRRMGEIVDQLIEVKAHQLDKSLMDQDVFNQVIAENVINLPIKYNFLYTNLNRAKNHYSMQNLNQLYGTSYANLREIFMDAAIIHFSSKDKPWKCTEAPMARKWYECYQNMKADLEKNGSDLTVIYEYEDKLPEDERLRNSMRCRNVRNPISSSELIISLTSFPARIESVNEVIDSLFEQSEIADRIILWLAESQFPNKEEDLPEALLDQTHHGLEIKWCDDIRSHKKYLYTMKENPDAIVVITDDDMIYDDQMLAYLYKSYMKYPNCISANRVHVMGFDEQKNVMSYMKWPQEVSQILLKPSMALIAVGVGGVLYPPDCLYEGVLDIKQLEEICPTTDDLWLKMMSVLKGTRTVCAYPNSTLNLIKETQKEALYKINRAGGENDRQLGLLIDYCKKIDNNVCNQIYKDYMGIKDTLKTPIVSVILPINDKDAEIRRCMNSLLAQSLKEVEILIFDNGSKGRVPQEYIRYNNVSVILQNATMGEEVNLGLNRAKGKYIVIADANISYETDFLKKMYYKASQDDADIVLAKVDYVDYNRDICKASEWEKKYFRLPAKAYFNFNDVKYDRFNTFSYRITDKMYRKEFLDKQALRLNAQGNGYGDIGFIYETIIKAEKIVYINEIIFRQNMEFKLRHAQIHNWQFICNSLMEFQRSLKENDVWNIYEQDYVNFSLNVLLHEYALAKADEIADIYSEMKNVWFEALEITAHESNYFYDQQLYEQSRYIQKFDYFWPLVKSSMGMENQGQEYLKELRREIKKLREENIKLKDKCEQLKIMEYCLEETRKSKSYKIGLLLTALPRKIRHRKGESK